MNKTEIMNDLTRTFHKVVFKLKKHSPEILVVAGVAGTVASAVMACKATTKLNDIIDETKEETHNLHIVAAAAGLRDFDDATEEDRTKIALFATKESVQAYTSEDLKKDTFIIGAHTVAKFVKLYGPSIALGTLSIASILSGHNITRKRNIALAAAYATVDKSFKEYRSRVVERFGEELDRELRYNIKAKEIEETAVDENGKEKTIKKTVDVVDPNDISEFARFFDDGCIGWEKDAEHNLFFLKQQQNWANERLQKRGYLFLNEVYEMLGIPATRAGQQVGWIYDKDNPQGDNFVDFGIYDINRPKARDFVNGYERTILLDFNVDGNILNMF